MFTVYILFSTIRDKYYIGFTSDTIAERLRRHLSNHSGFTGGTADWVVVYSEVFQEKSHALKRETEIKNWKSKKRIEKLIHK